MEVKNLLYPQQGKLLGHARRSPQHSPAMRRPTRRLLTCEYELQKRPQPPLLPPPLPPPPGEAKQVTGNGMWMHAA